MAQETPRPRVAIVIPTANPDREPAREAIARARQTTARLGATLHVVVSSGPGFRFSRSVNRGMAQAPDADAWVLLNDDCFMDDGWLEAMLDTVRRHPEVGVVGPLLRWPDGRIHHAGGYLAGPFWYVLHSTVADRAPLWALRRVMQPRARTGLYGGNHHRLRPGHRIDFVAGTCMLITRACRDRIGGFDEGFEFSFEDFDYCLRALEAGFELGLAVDARGVHLDRATGGSLHEATARSERFLQAKWPKARMLEVTRRGGRRGIQHSAGPRFFCACPAPAGDPGAKRYRGKARGRARHA
jgi:GT2 family glycosyltransferase